MPLVILHHLLNVTVQLANKRGLKKLAFTMATSKYKVPLLLILPTIDFHLQYRDIVSFA
jgi:hypothetical protein